MFSLPLLAFGFGNLAMLGWLAAAAAPLLIHLWSRHRFREAPWAAMQFLLAAMRKNARRMRLQQWLLLAVRTLIIALVVLAVAEPYGDRLLASLSGAPSHKILVIDGSYSMDYRDDGASRFARAKRAAATIVHESRSADTFTVIIMAAPARTIFGREVVDHAAVLAQIDSLTQPHTGADLDGALQLVEESIASGSSDRRTSDRHEVYFLSDLQQTTWQFNSDAAAGNKPLVSDRIAFLAKQASLAVIVLGQPQFTNLAVTSLAVSDAFVTAGRDVAFDVTLRQFGDEPRPQCAVELLIDGVFVSEHTVDVPAGAEATVRFTHRFQTPGEHSVEVRAAGDRLKIDNSRWLVVPVRDEVRVLCIAGRPGAAKYVADALNPNLAGDSPIRPLIVSEGDVADIELSDFDCIFACNVAQFTAGEAERLARYASAGGGLVFFLGDRVVHDSYNALAMGGWGRGVAEPPVRRRSGGSSAAGGLDPSHPPLLPAIIGELVSQPQFGLDPLDYRHPIVAPFRGRERAGLLTTPVARYFKLDVAIDRPDVQVAAAMPSGDPFIVTAPLGRGRTVMIATDGSLSSVDATTGEPWTNWPTWPSFLPVVRELLTYATSGEHQLWQQLVGTPLASRGVPAPAQPAVANVTRAALNIKRPDGHTAPVSIQSSPTGIEWTYADTDLSGIYTLLGLPNDESQQFAINVDTRESDLRQADPQQLPPELQTLDNMKNTSDRGGSVGVSRAGWNESLLWTALALMFVESFLVWQFGRGAV
ncbi:MAG: VWA domain-containing protein [Planctomycetes bacterium]|nr:VWA domain-containing protein [Planctomycetota bacterium]